MTIHPAFSLPILLLLAGCAAPDARIPSLAPRAGEAAGFDEPAVAAPARVSADPALDARLADAARKLDTVVRGFDGDAARAQAATRLSGARTVGSEAWLSAQSAVATLDDWRAQATAIAGDLDTMSSERLGAVGSSYPALDALRARALTEAEREGAVIARLSAALPTP